MRTLETPARACGYSPDGNEIAVGFVDGSWIVVESTNLQTIAEGKDRSYEIAATRYSPDGKYLAVASYDAMIDVYNVADNYNRVGQCKGHTNKVLHFDWSEDSSHIQSMCSTFELLYWDISKGCKQVKQASLLRDVVFHTQSCTVGWGCLAYGRNNLIPPVAQR